MLRSYEKKKEPITNTLICILCSEEKLKDLIDFSCQKTPKHIICKECFKKSKNVCPFCYPLDCTLEKIKERTEKENEVLKLELKREKEEEEQRNKKRAEILKPCKKCEICSKICAIYDTYFEAADDHYCVISDELNNLHYFCHQCYFSQRLVPKCKICYRLVKERKGYCKFCYSTMKDMFYTRRDQTVQQPDYLKSVGICSDNDCRKTSEFTRSRINQTLGEKVEGTDLWMCDYHYKRRHKLYCADCFSNSKLNSISDCPIHKPKCRGCDTIIGKDEKWCGKCMIDKKCCVKVCNLEKHSEDDVHYNTCVLHIKSCGSCRNTLPIDQQNCQDDDQQNCQDDSWIKYCNDCENLKCKNCGSSIILRYGNYKEECDSCYYKINGFKKCNECKDMYRGDMCRHCCRKCDCCRAIIKCSYRGDVFICRACQRYNKT